MKINQYNTRIFVTPPYWTLLNINFVSEGDQGILEIELNSKNSTAKSKYELIKNDISLNLSVCINYLSAIFKMSSISHNIILNVSENKPLNIEIQTNDSNKHNYYIAPKC